MHERKGGAEKFAKFNWFSLLIIGSVLTHEYMPAELACSQQMVAGLGQNVNCSVWYQPFRTIGLMSYLTASDRALKQVDRLPWQQWD